MKNKKGNKTQPTVFSKLQTMSRHKFIQSEQNEYILGLGSKDKKIFAQTKNWEYEVTDRSISRSKKQRVEKTHRSISRLKKKPQQPGYDYIKKHRANKDA